MSDFLQDELKYYYPQIYEDSVAIIKKSGYEAIVKTKDGKAYSFYSLDQSLRKLPPDPNNLTKEEFQNEFGINLYNMLWNKGYTEKTLAKELGISQVMVSRYISGKVVPSFYIVDKIAKVLDCSTDDFRYIY